MNWAEIVTKAKVHANIFHLRHWNKNVSAYKWQETFRHLIRLVENEQLRFMKVHSTYDLADVKTAVDVVQSAEKTKGKFFDGLLTTIEGVFLIGHLNRLDSTFRNT